MKYSYFFLLLLFSFFLIISCGDDESSVEDDNPPIHFENSTIEAFVQIETDTGLIPAIGARIHLFETEDDRADNYDVEVVGTTNGLGKHTFSGLSRPAYWITVQAPDGRIIYREENSPFLSPGHPIVSNALNVIFEK